MSKDILVPCLGHPVADLLHRSKEPVALSKMHQNCAVPGQRLADQCSLETLDLGRARAEFTELPLEPVQRVKDVVSGLLGY